MKMSEEFLHCCYGIKDVGIIFLCVDWFGSVERSSYLDLVRAARFPSSERSSPTTGSARPRLPVGAAPDLRGKNNNPQRRQKDLKTNQTIQLDRQVQSFLQFLSQFLSTFHCRDQRCASTQRSFLSPGERIEPGAQPWEDPSGQRGHSLTHSYSVANVTTGRLAPAAAASSADGTFREVVGWR